ncbi:cyclic-phosphate processing receiver domain-containing protein [Streptomyces melanogenes]|uniref:cyclic-phosphate processing receiver domain-containing protein n=1 Tax=Streptomyces melanogenes TaxID=67326 RepID=UPI003788BEE5
MKEESPVPSPVILGIDDLRPLPWTTRIARSSGEGVKLLQEHRDSLIDELWLDHDLGGDDSILPVMTLLEEAAFNGRPFRIGTGSEVRSWAGELETLHGRFVHRFMTEHPTPPPLTPPHNGSTAPKPPANAGTTPSPPDAPASTPQPHNTRPHREAVPPDPQSRRDPATPIPQQKRHLSRPTVRGFQGFRQGHRTRASSLVYDRTPPCCPDPVSYGRMSRPSSVRNGSHRIRQCRWYGRKI